MTLSTASVSFNSRNWNTPKPVTVRATSIALTQDESTPAERRDATIDLRLNVDGGASNNDDAYNDVEGVSVDVTISNPQIPSGVSVTTNPSTLTIQEGSDREYTVRLSRAARGDETDNVTIHLSSSETSVTLSRESLTFTADNDEDTGWNVPRPVTVSVARDLNAVEEKAVLAHRWGTGGPVVKTVAVNVDEIDTRGVTVSTTNLEVTEGQSNTYSIALESDPVDGGPVTVTISSSSDDVTVDPSQWTFTTGGAAETVKGAPLGMTMRVQSLRHLESYRSRRGLRQHKSGQGHGRGPGEGHTRSCNKRPDAAAGGRADVDGRGKRHLHGQTEITAHGNSNSPSAE